MTPSDPSPLVTITAVIRARPGAGDAMCAALAEVALDVEQNEPGTVGFFISRDPVDPTLFTMYEQFVDTTAMDRHNGSAAVAKFYALAPSLWDGENGITIYHGQEIAPPL